MTDLDLDDELQRQLRRWADDVAVRVPPYRHASTPTRHVPTTRHLPLRVAVAAVAATVAIGAGAMWRAQTNTDSRVATQGAAFMVRHERFEVQISAEVSCASIDASATFDRATVDIWADMTNRRYRTRVTHPDGSNYDIIAIGSPYYPSELYERGQQRLGPLGCAGQTGFAEGGAGATGYSLNAMAEIPRSPSGDPLVEGLLERTTPVDGVYADSLGRPANLREKVTTGGYTGLGLTSAPVVQTTRVFVDPVTGEINEATYTNEIQGLGHLNRIATRTLSATEPATDDLFDHNGYERQPVQAPPTMDNSPRPTVPQSNPPRSTI